MDEQDGNFFSFQSTIVGEFFTKPLIEEKAFTKLKIPSCLSCASMLIPQAD